jgi:hypothetical protein
MALRKEAIEKRPELTVLAGGRLGRERIQQWTQTAGSERSDGSHSLTGVIIDGPEHVLFNALTLNEQERIKNNGRAVVDISGRVSIHPRLGEDHYQTIVRSTDFDKEEKIRRKKVLDPNGDHRTLGLPLVSAVYEAESMPQSLLPDRQQKIQTDTQTQTTRVEKSALRVRDQVDDGGLAKGRKRKQIRKWTMG